MFRENKGGDDAYVTIVYCLVGGLFKLEVEWDAEGDAVVPVGALVVARCFQSSLY